MIILLGMWLCILYCIIKYVIELKTITSIILFSFIIFSFCTIMGADAGHIGLGMVIGILLVLFGLACSFEGEKRVNEAEKTKEEIQYQNEYDDNWGFNDFNK